jgi:hypothetical protein
VNDRQTEVTRENAGPSMLPFRRLGQGEGGLSGKSALHASRTNGIEVKRLRRGRPKETSRVESPVFVVSAPAATAKTVRFPSLGADDIGARKGWA